MRPLQGRPSEGTRTGRGASVFFRALVSPKKEGPKSQLWPTREERREEGAGCVAFSSGTTREEKRQGWAQVKQARYNIGKGSGRRL